MDTPLHTRLTSAPEKARELLSDMAKEWEKITAPAFDYASGCDLRLPRQIYEKDPEGKVLNTDPHLVQFGTGTSMALNDCGSVVCFTMPEAESG